MLQTVDHLGELMIDSLTYQCNSLQIFSSHNEQYSIFPDNNNNQEVWVNLGKKKLRFLEDDPAAIQAEFYAHKWS